MCNSRTKNFFKKGVQYSSQGEFKEINNLDKQNIHPRRKILGRGRTNYWKEVIRETSSAEFGKKYRKKVIGTEYYFIVYGRHDRGGSIFVQDAHFWKPNQKTFYFILYNYCKGHDDNKQQWRLYTTGIVPWKKKRAGKTTRYATSAWGMVTRNKRDGEIDKTILQGQSTHRRKQIAAHNETNTP